MTIKEGPRPLRDPLGENDGKVSLLREIRR